MILYHHHFVLSSKNTFSCDWNGIKWPARAWNATLATERKSTKYSYKGFTVEECCRLQLRASWLGVRGAFWMVEKRGRRRVEGFNVLVWICLKPSTTKETKIQCSLNYHPAIATSNISKYYYSMRVRFRSQSLTSQVSWDFPIHILSGKMNTASGFDTVHQDSVKLEVYKALLLTLRWPFLLSRVSHTSLLL